MNIRCKVNYRSIRKSLLENFALNVLNMIFTHMATFPAPPVTAAILQALITDFATKYAGFKARTISKADMQASRLALITALDTLSNYVNSIANGDAIIIGESGFDATKGSASDVTPPLKPVGVTFSRTNSGELTGDCPVVAGAENYGAVVVTSPLGPDVYINEAGQIVVNDGSSPSPMPPPPGPSSGSNIILDLTKNRRKKFIALTVGVTYYIYYWAANSAGVSPLSDGVSKKVVE